MAADRDPESGLGLRIRDSRFAVLECRIPSPESRVDRELRPDDRLEPRLLRGFMKSRRAVDAIGIEQRERGIAKRRRALDERFGQ